MSLQNVNFILGIHQHVVRYYSAWAEDNHMIIQNEFCNGGSLADKIENEVLSILDLRRLTAHIAEGLRYIHSLDLVHLDIKPANIFISTEIPTHYTCYDSAEEDFFEGDDHHSDNEEVTYKIGDLGHVTSINKPRVSILFFDCDVLYNFAELIIIIILYSRLKRVIADIYHLKYYARNTFIYQKRTYFP